MIPSGFLLGEPGEIAAEKIASVPQRGAVDRRAEQHGPRLTVGAVAFSKTGVFVGEGSIVIESGLPQHASVGHHAGLDGAHFLDVALSAGVGVAGLRGGEGVAGVAGVAGAAVAGPPR